jgi:hypothetical protein
VDPQGIERFASGGVPGAETLLVENDRSAMGVLMGSMRGSVPASILAHMAARFELLNR